ncbi:MAG: 16S rRNA (cytosine(1402)-N(4))-methyltransferase RsmH [Anaerolineae bacterium]|nr:16S rRNA (cytosine(1402)-N(4))-methyltransferase RsmH [Anaerolineae bacterium]
MIVAQHQEHVPVMLDRVMELLVTGRDGLYIDGTVGAGGHAAAILEAAGSGARLLGMDADPAALTKARRNLAAYEPRVTLVHSNYRHMHEAAVRVGFSAVDGILLDLGLSSMQLDSSDRGFAFRLGGPLDMRFDPRTRGTAAHLLNSAEAPEIARILRRYGEEPFARRIAHFIVGSRPVTTAEQLAEIVTQAVPQRQAANSLARTFQALRIAVNDELGALEEGLSHAVDLLGPQGRLAVISFHSLEDRIVKAFFRRLSQTCTCPPDLPVCVCGTIPRLKPVTRRPVFPSEEEVQMNPRSRSARLRVAEKI